MNTRAYTQTISQKIVQCKERKDVLWLFTNLTDKSLIEDYGDYLHSSVVVVFFFFYPCDALSS